MEVGKSKIRVSAWSSSVRALLLVNRLLSSCVLKWQRQTEREREREREGERERTSPLVSLLIRALIPSWVPQHHDLI